MIRMENVARLIERNTLVWERDFEVTPDRLWQAVATVALELEHDLRVGVPDGVRHACAKRRRKLQPEPAGDMGFQQLLHAVVQLRRFRVGICTGCRLLSFFRVEAVAVVPYDGARATRFAVPHDPESAVRLVVRVLYYLALVTAADSRREKGLG